MANKEIRLGQLIAPFGSGSLYTDSRGIPHIICGLDHWHTRWCDGCSKPCDDPKEFVRLEPRLSELLKVDCFRIPPDFRRVSRHANPEKMPPNHSLYVPAHRFPTWYRHTSTGRLKKFKLDTVADTIRQTPENREDSTPAPGHWQPVRFVAVCAAGHLCEFPWKSWCGCNCPDGVGRLYLFDQGGSDLGSIHIKCKECGKSKDLSGTTSRPTEETPDSAFSKAGINCSGDRPWLGPMASQPGCPGPLVGALINQTSIYFPRTISAISLPWLQAPDDSLLRLRETVKKLPQVGSAKALWRMKQTDEAVSYVKSFLPPDDSSESVKAVLKNLFDDSLSIQSADAAKPADPESSLVQFRRAEFNILRNEIDDPTKSPDLRVVSATVSEELQAWFGKVNLVESLLETRAFFGFDRLEQTGRKLQNALATMPEPVMEQLFFQPPQEAAERWLPAVEVFGEGIYIELGEEALIKWQTDNAAWLQDRLDDQFLRRLENVFQVLSPIEGMNRKWASRYLLVHSLAHILINQLVFECGYSTASLRERLYVSADSAAPMAGFMIYTAAGDHEGTLGGLVRLGRPDRLGPVVSRALSRASWCSADPVCSENLGGQGSQLANLAACHGCVLLPETSCETINHGLDRAMVVGTPENRAPGFMAALVDFGAAQDGES